MSSILALVLGALGFVPDFVDAAAEAGLTVVTYCGGAAKDHILESTGNGILVIDYDLDGFADLYFVNAERFPERGTREPHSSVLYRNLGDGTFEDVTHRAGVATRFFGQGGAVGDVDGDGLPDLYVTAWGDNILFRNNGDGTFADWTSRADVGVPGWSLGASFFDADGDGDEDLFVGNYLETMWDEVVSAKRTRQWRGRVDVLDGPKGLRTAANVFLRNDGDGTFTDATKDSGFDAGGEHFSMGVTTLDYDRDGLVDVYVANDSTPNALYRNTGGGRFREVGVEAGVAYSTDGMSQGSMGVDAGDVDGDGLFDLALTNFAHDYYTLYRNLGGGLFFDDSFDGGIAVATFAPLGWGTVFLDVDHDGDLDLFFANGHIYPQVDGDPALGESYAQRNQLLLNDGRGRFTDVTAEAGSGFEIALSSRGAVAADLNHDGSFEIVVGNIDQSPTLLTQAAPPNRHWLSVRLVGRRDRLALGARVDITAGGKQQVRHVVSGGSYASQNDLSVHFGLGEADRVERLRVTWSDGATDTYESLAVNHRYVIKQGHPPIEIP